MNEDNGTGERTLYSMIGFAGKFIRVVRDEPANAFCVVVNDSKIYLSNDTTIALFDVLKAEMEKLGLVKKEKEFEIPEGVSGFKYLSVNPENSEVTHCQNLLGSVDTTIDLAVRDDNAAVIYKAVAYVGPKPNPTREVIR